jgi:CBS domain-containing protein
MIAKTIIGMHRCCVAVPSYRALKIGAQRILTGDGIPQATRRGSLKASEVMRREIVTVDEKISVAEASLNMRKKGEGCAIILRQGVPFGMVTERDVTWKVAGNGLDPKNVSVAEIMSTPLITIDPDVELREAAKVMERHKIRRLAVVRGKVLYGVLIAADIASHLESYMDQEAREILGYIWAPRYYPIDG